MSDAGGGRPEGVRRSVLLVMASQGVGALALIGIPVVLTRVFDKADYGLYQQFQLLLQTVLILAVAGFPEALVYFVARKKNAAIDVLLGSLLQMAATLAVLGVVLALAGTWIVTALADERLAPFVPALCLAVAGYAAGDTLFIAQTAQKKFGAYAAVYVGFALFQSALLIGVSWWWRHPAAAIWAVAAGGVVKGIAALGWIAWEWRRTGWTARPGMVRDQWNYALPFAGAQVLKKINGQLHKYFVTAGYSPEAYATYDIGTKKVPALGMLRGSVVQVLTPHFAEMEEQQRIRAMLGLWHASAARLALIYFPVAATLIAFAPELVEIFFTADYLDAVPIFRIFTLLMLAETLGGLEALLKAFAQNRFILWTTALQLGLALLGSWLGLRWIGLPGPAIAVVVSTYVGTFVRLARIPRLLRVPFGAVMPWGRLGTVLATAAAAAGLGFACSRLLDGPWSRLAIGLPVAGGAFLAAGLSFGLIPETERAAIASRLRRISGRGGPKNS